MEDGMALDSLPLFFFNDTATTEIYTLSLHDALPICHIAVELIFAAVKVLLPLHKRVRVFFVFLADSGMVGQELLQCRMIFHKVLVVDQRDRKSTRLNSSHQIISYAVFCLQKKKTYHA